MGYTLEIENSFSLAELYQEMMFWPPINAYPE